MRDIFTGFDFQGKVTINETGYYWWSAGDMFPIPPLVYMTDQSEKLRPKRIAIASDPYEYAGFDFILNTYS